MHSSEVKERLSALEVGVKAERARPTIVYPPTPPMTDDASSQYSEEPPSRDALGVATVSPELSLEVLNGKEGLRKRSFGAPLSLYFARLHPHGFYSTRRKVRPGHPQSPAR